MQFEWIVTLQGNLDVMFRDDPDVFVAGDHLIYPVEGNAEIRQAPDVYVAFGRPKGHRGSYRVFAEDNIFPQVVFEVWSPGNTAERMEQKRLFYERYGAEEYYILYPDFPAHLQGWCRDGDSFVRIENMHEYTSPRLQIRFTMERGHVAVFWPDGRPFLSYMELGVLQQETAARFAEQKQQADAERRRAEEERKHAETERKRAEEERTRAETERKRAEEERKQADAERKRAEEERKHAEAARTRAERLAAKLREMGIDPDAV